MHCEAVSLSRLADKFGTPLYVYSGSMIRERYRTFDRVFKTPHTVCYSVKANSNLGILRLLSSLGCGFDVISGGELERVLKVSRKAARNVVFSGVGKQVDELDRALRADILLFNVESEAELELLAARAERLKKLARVALRVNPDVPAETHPYISTGLQQHKFGIPIGEARRLYARAADSLFLEVAGVSVHIGSQITSIDPFAAAMERVAELVRQLRNDGHTIQYVDAGGGLGIAYEKPQPNSFSEYASQYAEAVSQPLRGLKVHVLLEPGRAIVGPAGVLLTRVLYRKSNASKSFVVVDAAMNDLLRPALYSAFHEIVPIQSRAAKQELVDVVGPVCETGDFLARDRNLPAVKEGELLAILDVGAYGMVLASNYNTRPRPAEILVEGSKARMIRKRETVAELMRGEK
ncbi:MAG TPA: diaminopimelate decarboxylase [Terriglobales bacterium]|nr:diaminopimelate decarboxylase [Terriglobales bacterium]